MKVELGDLIQASELGKNMGGFLAEAAAGRRMVVLYNGVPMGALVGLEDFEKIGAPESPVYGSHPMAAAASVADLAGDATVTFWQLAESLPARHTAVGVMPNGGCVTLPVAAHYLFVGEDEQDLLALQRSAILGATMTASPDEVQVVLATTRSVHSFSELNPLKVPHVVADARDLEFAEPAERLILQLRGEVARRGRMLRESRVGSIARYRDKFPDRAADVPDLIVVVDYAHELHQVASEVWQLLQDIGRRLDYYGIYVWQFATELPTTPPKWVATRIAGRVATAAESRSLLFTTDAARNVGAGEAYIGLARSPAELFKIVAPAEGTLPIDVYESRMDLQSAPPWPVFPDSVDLADVIDLWRTKVEAPVSFSDAVVPIGLHDRPDRREVAVWSVALRAPVWIWGATAPAAARARVLELIVQSAAQAYPTMQVWAIGLGLAPSARVVRAAQQASELLDELYVMVKSGKGRVGLPEDKWVLLVINRDVAVDIDEATLEFFVEEGPGCGVCVVQTTQDIYPIRKPENWIELSDAGRHAGRFGLLASAPEIGGKLVNASDLVQMSAQGA